MPLFRKNSPFFIPLFRKETEFDLRIAPYPHRFRITAYFPRLQHKFCPPKIQPQPDSQSLPQTFFQRPQAEHFPVPLIFMKGFHQAPFSFRQHMPGEVLADRPDFFHIHAKRSRSHRADRHILAVADIKMHLGKIRGNPGIPQPKERKFP